MTKIRCAIVGLGRIGYLLEDDPRREKPASHAGAIDACPNTVLCGGADTDPSRRKTFASRRPEVPLYANAEHLLEVERPHILHVATHPETHCLYIELAASHGVPLVLCEKPLASKPSQARETLRRLSKTDTKLMVNHERRFAADYRHVRKRIEEKTYGRLLGIGASLYMGRRSAPKAVLRHDGTHIIDAICFLTGRDLEVWRVEGDPGKDGGDLFIRGRSGAAPVSLYLGGRRDHLVFELDLSFERGRIRIGNGIYEEYRSDISNLYSGIRSLRQERPFDFHRTGYFSGVMEEAVKAVREASYIPDSTGLDGLRAMETIEIILCQARS